MNTPRDTVTFIQTMTAIVGLAKEWHTSPRMQVLLALADNVNDLAVRLIGRDLTDSEMAKVLTGVNDDA